MKILVGKNSECLAKKIMNSDKFINRDCFAEVIYGNFSDGEISVEVSHKVRGEDVYIIFSMSANESSSMNDSIMEMLLTIDAVHRIGVKSVSLIITYFAYSRQDRVMVRKEGSHTLGSSLSLALMARLLESICNLRQVCVFNPHFNQLMGFFGTTKVEYLCMFKDLAKHYQSIMNVDEVAVVAPDAGAIVGARKFASYLDMKSELVILEKFRAKAGVSSVMNVIGDVDGKHCVIVDDIIDSAGTMCNAVEILHKKGALSVTSCVVHGVLSGKAFARIQNSSLKYICISDSIPDVSRRVDNSGIDFFHIVSCADKIIDYIVDDMKYLG